MIIIRRFSENTKWRYFENFAMEPKREKNFSLAFRRSARFFKSDDEFFQDGNKFCFSEAKHFIKDEDLEQLSNLIANCKVGQLLVPCEVKGCKETFISSEAYELHFQTVHKYNCGVCGRNFPSNFLLDVHITENHDSFFQARRDRGDSVLVCLVESCNTAFKDENDRQRHLVEVHQYPSNFRFNRVKKKHSRKQKIRSESKELTENKSQTMEVEETTFGEKSDYQDTTKDSVLGFDKRSNGSSEISFKTRGVPHTINFGRGCSKTFSRSSRGGKNKQKQ